jgi:Flp pilus assembly protein TadD
LAGEQIDLGQRQEAVDSLYQAMAMHEVLYPGDGYLQTSVIQALQSLGDEALDSGHYGCALLFYSRAADARPLAEEASDEEDRWRNLAEASFSAEQYTEAIAAYERLLELVPDHWKYQVRLARAYQANGQVDKAVVTLEQAIMLAPDEPRPRRALANAYLLKGQMGQAADAFERVLENKPGDVEARFGLALAHEALGHKAEAIREFQAVIEIDPEHWLAKEAQKKLATYEQ